MNARRCFGLTAFLIVPLTVATQAASPETNSLPRLTESSGDFLEKFLQMIGAFILVISILILGAWLFKRSRFFSLYKSGQSQLQILESRSLGYRNSLLVVGYSQHRFLLAASATGVSLISPLPDASPHPQTSSGQSAFSDQLKSAQERKP